MTSPTPPPRTHALDNLRTTLTILVILHHAAIPYGGLGAFSYKSLNHPPGSSLPLVAFNVLNQTYFMALFFLISGYFSSIAAAKRTRGEFVQEKVKRLGVPTVGYTLLGTGVVGGLVGGWGSGDADTVLKESWHAVRRIRGVKGPVWYTALLLVFDVIYCVVFPGHFISRNQHAKPSPPSPNKDKRINPPTTLSTTHLLKTPLIIAALLLAATAEILLRAKYPFGYIFTLLNLNPGYTPQYILYYTSGIYLQRCQIPLHTAVSKKSIYLIASLAVVVAASGISNAHKAVRAGVDGLEILEMAGGAGGVNCFAVYYATLNEFVGFTISALLLRAFNYFGFLSMTWRIPGRKTEIARDSYAAFLVHVPVLVGVLCSLDGWEWSGVGAIGMAVGVGWTAVVGSWVLGALMRRGLEGIEVIGVV